MKIKKFQADTLPEAVAMMKAEFGEEAVILYTKVVKKGRFFGLFGKKCYEVLGAVDPNRQAAKNSSKKTAVNTNPPNTAADEEELVDIEERASSVQELFQLLLRQDISQKLAVEILKPVLQQVPKREWTNLVLLKQHLRTAVSAKILVDPPWDLMGEQKTVVFLGPTGVGKTTTIAKIAANYHLIAQKKVGLITLDTYRIAAVEQLKTYADIINVPLKVVYSGAELEEAVASYQDRDLILIDTAGRSHQNEKQMAELEAALAGISAEKYLVLSATTKGYDLMAIIDAYRPIEIDNLIITKLDETQSFGILVQAPSYAQVPIAFITNGQSVPDDIEVADIDQLTNMILGD